MRYLSVCSGIEAATVAWHPLGWTPVAFSEIEPFPAAVLAHHYPNVPNYGDMTKHKEWPLEPGSIDLLVGGTPCQSFSVAGLRKGISDPRGGLMLTYLEIAQRLRPRWIVWENVPGVLSSGGGRDFGSFLGALGELGYGWAYRIIDAQYCRVDGRWPKAVPQRRRRVFVVGCDLERDPGGRERAAEVLALGTGLRWHLAESGKTRKATPADAPGGIGASSIPSCADTVTSKWSKGAEALQQGAQSGGNCIGLHAVTESTWPAEVAPTLNQSARGTGAPGYSDQEIFSQGAGNLVPQPVLSIQGAATRTNPASGPDGVGVSQSGVAYTLEARAEVQAVAQPVPYDLFQITAPVNRQNRKPGDPCHTLARDNAAHAAVAFAQNQVGEVRTGDVSGTLNTNSNASGRNTPMAAVAFTRCDNGGDASVEVTPTMRCGSNYSAHPAVAFNWQNGGGYGNANEGLGITIEGTGPIQRCNTPAVACPTLTAHNDPSRSPQSSEVTQQVAAVHAASMTVRRLTPRECERLQAFPDDYTLIPWRGKTAEQCPDGPRYKALGNSMAVNCMAWIGERIAAVEARDD